MREETAPREKGKAKALRWEGGGHVIGMARKPRQLEQMRERERGVGDNGRERKL